MMMAIFPRFVLAISAAAGMMTLDSTGTFNQRSMTISAGSDYPDRIKLLGPIGAVAQSATFPVLSGCRWVPGCAASQYEEETMSVAKRKAESKAKEKAKGAKAHNGQGEEKVPWYINALADEMWGIWGRDIRKIVRLMRDLREQMPSSGRDPRDRADAAPIRRMLPLLCMLNAEQATNLESALSAATVAGFWQRMHDRKQPFRFMMTAKGEKWDRDADTGKCSVETYVRRDGGLSCEHVDRFFAAAATAPAHILDTVLDDLEDRCQIPGEVKHQRAKADKQGDERHVRRFSAAIAGLPEVFLNDLVDDVEERCDAARNGAGWSNDRPDADSATRWTRGGGDGPTPT